MARQKKNQLAPDTSDTLEDDANGPEGYAAQQGAPATDGYWLEAQLGDWKNIPNAKKRIDLNLLVEFTHENVNVLADMVDFVCRIEEPGRGVPGRAPLPLLQGEVIDWKVTKGGAKQGGFRDKEIKIKMELDFSAEISKGLFQIAEASPPTLILQMTQQPLQLTSAPPGKSKQMAIPGEEE